MTTLERYHQRRDGCERFFLDNPPKQEIFEREDGAKIKVYSESWIVPDHLKKPENGKFRISLYVPGLFEMDKPNLGNHPLESKLMGALLTGESDAVFVLKAEGMNSLAYKNAQGDPHGESLVSEAAAEVLERELAQLKKQLGLNDDISVEFEVAGYSEGSTQGASISEKIIEKGLGKVNAYTSLGGAGLVGYENQNEARPTNFVLKAIKNRKHAKFDQVLDMEKPWVEIRPDMYIVSRKLIGDKEQGGFEYSLGKAEVSMEGDVRNIGKWSSRYIATRLGLGNQVPHERLQAVCSINHDYDKLIENGVPLIVLSGTEEIFFQSDEVSDAVKKLKSKGGRVLFITSDLGHGFPHKHPSGTAYTLAAFRQKAGL